MPYCCYIVAENEINKDVFAVAETPRSVGFFDMLLMSNNPKPVKAKFFSNGKTTAVRSDYTYGVKLYFDFLLWMKDNYLKVMPNDKWDRIAINENYFEEEFEKAQEFFAPKAAMKPKYLRLETGDLLAFCDNVIMSRVTFLKILSDIKRVGKNISDVVYNNGKMDEKTKELLITTVSTVMKKSKKGYSFAKDIKFMEKKTEPFRYNLTDKIYYELNSYEPEIIEKAEVEEPEVETETADLTEYVAEAAEAEIEGIIADGDEFSETEE